MKKIIFLLAFVFIVGCVSNHPDITYRSKVKPEPEFLKQVLSAEESKEAQILLNYFNKKYPGSSNEDIYYVDIDNDGLKELLIALNTYSGANKQMDKENETAGFSTLSVAVVFPKGKNPTELIIVVSKTLNKGMNFSGKGLFKPVFKNGLLEQVNIIAKNNKGESTYFTLKVGLKKNGTRQLGCRWKHHITTAKTA